MTARAYIPDDSEASERAVKFVKEHPDAWSLFCRFSLELAAHRRHAGAKAVMERIRWQCATTAHTRRDTRWKLNNSLVSELARGFSRAYPEHASLFTFRRRRNA